MHITHPDDCIKFHAIINRERTERSRDENEAAVLQQREKERERDREREREKERERKRFTHHSVPRETPIRTCCNPINAWITPRP